MKTKAAVLTHRTHHPVARKASALANRSAIVKSVNPIRQAIAAIMPSARRPCRNRTKVGKAVGFFGVAVKS
jgi:cell division FtsZ-interacting protein ZapD